MEAFLCLNHWQIIEVDAVDGAAGDTGIYEPEIVHHAISGYTKRFVLSRAILRENDQPIEYRAKEA